MIENQYALSTIDNPFNPFDDFVSWFMFDVEKGYNTCGKLARMANVTDDMTEIEALIEIEDAIDKIITYDPFGIYIKVSRKYEPQILMEE